MPICYQSKLISRQEALEIIEKRGLNASVELGMNLVINVAAHDMPGFHACLDLDHFLRQVQSARESWRCFYVHDLLRRGCIDRA